MGNDDIRRNRPELTTARIDEAIVEPARWGLRRLGAGLGKVASAAMVVIGLMSGAVGATLMALTSIGFFDGLGALFLALGLTGATFGTFGLLAVKRADVAVEARAVERRLLKMIRADGSVTDEDAALRMRAPREQVRAAAERLVRTGVLDVDVDPNTGVDVYCAVDSAPANALPPAELDALRGFDDALDAAARQKGADAVGTAVEADVVGAGAHEARVARSDRN